MELHETLPERMLRLMQDGNWYSNEMLVSQVGHRFSATMHVLRQQGHEFEKRRIDGRRFEYRLVCFQVPSMGEQSE